MSAKKNMSKKTLLGQKSETPQPKKTFSAQKHKNTPNSEPKHRSKKADDSDSDISLKDIEALMNTSEKAKKTISTPKTPQSDSKKKNVVKFDLKSENKTPAATPLQNKTPVSLTKKAKKRARDSDDEVEEELKVPAKKMLKSPGNQSKSPANKPKSPAANQVKTPGSEKKDGPIKSILKRPREDDEEEEDDEQPEAVPEVKTPAKKKSKLNANSPKSAEKKAENESDDVQELLKKAQDEFNKRSLFIKNFDKTVKEDDLRKLSKDIVDVKIRVYFDKNKKEGVEQKKKAVHGYAYLRFKDEKTTEANYKLLQTKEINGQKLFVDFVGKKSTKGDAQQNNKKPEKLDVKRLYVTGFNKTTITAEKLKAAFPSSCNITLPFYKKYNCHHSFAFVQYDDEAVAMAVQKAKNEIDGAPVSVMFSRVKKAEKKSDLVKTDKELKKQEEKKKKQAKKEEVKVADKKEVTTEAKKVEVVEAKAAEKKGKKGDEKKKIEKMSKQEVEKLMKKFVEEDDDDDDDDDDDESDDDEDENDEEGEDESEDDDEDESDEDDDDSDDE